MSETETHSISVNGGHRRVPAGTTVAGLVQEIGFDPARVAVERNREQQKELQNRANTGDAGSPAATGPGDKVPGGTTRKCANCGQVGHIKTNKKYGPSPLSCTPS